MADNGQTLIGVVTMLKVLIEFVTRAVLFTLGNCRHTQSHAKQTGDAKRPFERMLENGRNGRPLWDTVEPAKVCSFAVWTKYMGKCKLPKCKDGRAVLTGNCRLLTHVDARVTLRDEGIDVTEDQLLIPIVDVSEQIHSRADIIRFQVGDNEKDQGRIKITPLEKLRICIDAKEYGLDPKQEAELKRRLEFNRGDQQTFAGIFKAEEYIPNLRERLLDCPQTGKELTDLRYAPNGPFPVSRWPRAKIVSLFTAARKSPEKVATLATDIEALLEKVLTGGVSAAKSLSTANWQSSADETPDGSFMRLLANCSKDGSLEPVIAALKPVLHDTPEAVRAAYDIGVYVMAQAHAGDKDAQALLDRFNAKEPVST
jgi:hypothetical protein